MSWKYEVINYVIQIKLFGNVFCEQVYSLVMEDLKNLFMIDTELFISGSVGCVGNIFNLLKLVFQREVV